MKTLEIPRHLRKRPLYKGLPIPYVALIKPDGQPDFRVVDEEKRRWVIISRRCQLCNEPLGRFFYFVGGVEAAKGNMYFEPATHLDCVIYAMQVCPFILGKIEHADIDKVKKQYAKAEVKRSVTVPGSSMKIDIHTDETYTTIRNPYWVIKKANDYKVMATPKGTILLEPRSVRETKPLHAESMTADDWDKVRKELM